MSGHDAIALDADDDVATVLRDVAAGETVRVRIGSRVRPLVAAEDVRRCHKIALHAVGAGVPVRKYGETIGEAVAAIAPGAHVHVHNLRSLRARGERGA